ncbi:alkaline phosphatase family protein, partial [Pengzhenrongella sp.]|uniref:alkaline phosphatase family protein n=1 Tax=Pengzhenrongella sp. TaxID=2888820 RepID=UPI002F92D355
MSRRRTARRIAVAGAALALAWSMAPANAAELSTIDPAPSQNAATTTPIKHLVVIYQENVSFDHYFATYPNATNPQSEPSFTAAKDTPTVNGLNESLLAPNNPNSVQPFRLD